MNHEKVYAFTDRFVMTEQIMQGNFFLRWLRNLALSDVMRLSIGLEPASNFCVH